MKNRTYFSDLALDHPHFILAGHTDDRCCNDALQLTSMEYELHRHLKDENYDAVVFYNRSQRVYCYDYRSYNLFCNIHCEDTATAAAEEATPAAASATASAASASPFIDLTADGPLGIDPLEEEEAVPAAPTAPAEAAAEGGNRRLCNRAIDTNAFWAQMEAMFRSDKKVALVLSNMNSMINAEHETGDFSANALNTLINLGQHSGQNKSIAIYTFRGLDFACMQEQLQGDGDEWNRFINACLLPLLDQKNTTPQTANHVIRITYPNAAEIRNLLFHLHYREETPLNIREADVEKVALKLANRCASDTLNNLIAKINRFIRENPDHLITPNNCHEMIFEANCNTAMQELDSFIGLSEVKEALKKIYAVAEQAGAKNMEMPKYSSRFTPRITATNLSHSLNVCLLGEPGTGKSAVARVLGRVYYEAGVLPTANVISVKPSDILSGAIGASGRAMEDYISRAMGGVLFIDEAYGLSEANAGNAGLEAINQLVGRMTDYEGQFAVVLAGYEKETLQLINDNAGLQSRFLTSRYFHLKPYSWEEMRDILLLMAKKQAATFHSEKLTPDEIRQVRAIIPSKNAAVQSIGSEYGLIWLDNFCENWVGDRGMNWGNAREAGNLLEEMKQNYAVRMKQDGTSSVGKYELTPLDVSANLRVHLKPRSKGLDEALDNLSKLIGLGPAKKFLKNLCATIRWDQKTGSESMNYLFIGPPGTGKTYFAEHMAEILNHLHVLRRRAPYIINASDLIHRLNPAENHGNANRETLASIVNRARGGMLFIDEAHQLKDSDAGRRIVRELVPIIETPEVRADTCFVLAGYQDEIEELLAVDSGLESRFPAKNRIKFVNYNPDELAQILEIFAKEKGYLPTKEYLTRTRNALNRYLDSVDHHFGNARFMRSEYLEESIKRRTKRLNKTHLLGVREDEREYAVPDEKLVLTVDHINRLEEADIPESMDGFAGPLGMPLLPYRNSETRLQELVGKEKIKDYVRAFKKSVGIPEFFDSNTGGGMHFVITGPPGVGRHTVAQVLASMLFEMGKLDNERPINRSKGDFEAQYVGQTVAQTRRVLSGAAGNMLIVNSPSSMVPKNSSDNTFGTEALATIVGAMSSNHDISIVFIDTPEGMDAVIKTVNGLRDRAVFFEIEALSPTEMQEIFIKKTENSFCFDEEIEELIPSFFLNWVSDRGGLGEKRTAWGNGSEVEALIKQLEMNWNRLNGEKRIVDGFPKRVITRAMFPEEMTKYLKSTKVNHETALRELMEMTGLDSVKQAILKIQRRLRRADKSCTIPGCYCLIGNPGTGKTTIARLMGGILKAVGILEQGHVIERRASDYLQHPERFDDDLKQARHGILFIDEAHQMRTSAGGQEVIRRLLSALEDPNVLRNTSIILAGYPMEMNQLLEFDNGLKSRFGTDSSKILFPDYTAKEMLSILQDMAGKAKSNPQISAPCNVTLSKEFCDISLDIFTEVCAQKDPRLGNARFVRNYLNDSIDVLLERLADVEEIAYHLTQDDIPRRFSRFKPSAATGSSPRRLPAKLVKGFVPTEPIRELITERMMRHYTPTVTVYLEVYQSGQLCGSGTGTIISREGHILTCEHVIDGADRVRARVYAPGTIGGDYHWFECDILHPTAKDIDMALLKMKGSNFYAASLRPEEDAIDECERILLAGYPLGSQLSNYDAETLQISHFFGNISSVQYRDAETVFADITGLQGNSGSPVFSMDDGRVIGVFTGSITHKGEQLTEENNFFHPIRLFWERFTVDLSRE